MYVYTPTHLPIHYLDELAHTQLNSTSLVCLHKTCKKQVQPLRRKLFTRIMLHGNKDLMSSGNVRTLTMGTTPHSYYKNIRRRLPATVITVQKAPTLHKLCAQLYLSSSLMCFCRQYIRWKTTWGWTGPALLGLQMLDRRIHRFCQCHSQLLHITQKLWALTFGSCVRVKCHGQSLHEKHAPTL